MQVGTGYPERRISAPNKPNSAGFGSLQHPQFSREINYQEPYEHHIHHPINPNPQIQHYSNQPQQLPIVSPKSLQLNQPIHGNFTQVVQSPNHLQYHN